MEKKAKQLSFLEIAIPFLYIAGEYKIASVPLSWILSFLVLFYLVAKYGLRKVGVFRPLLYLFVFMVFHDLVKGLYSTVNYGAWAERLLFFVLIVLLIGRVNEDLLFKVWSVLSIIVIAGIVFHSYQVYFLHIPATQIRVIPLQFFDEANAKYAYFRPRSIFSEPAACASWLLPLLAYSLKKSNVLFSVIITISILLTTSSVGVVMVAVLWIYTLFGNNAKMGLRRKIALTIIMIVFVWAFLETGIFSDTSTKILSISIDNGSDYSRVLLGLMLFINAPLLIKLWGIPYVTVEDYLRYGGIDLSRYHLSSNYSFLGFVNGFGNCILNYGIIGLILLVRFYYKLFGVVNNNIKGYYIVCVISLMCQSVFFNTYFLMQMAILLGTSEYLSQK